MAGFCRIWIPAFGLMAKPLYEALKGTDMEPLGWTGNLQRAFDQIKTALTSTPALGIPDLNKPFTLFTSGKQGIALRVLTQKVGPIPWPLACLSKQLDSVASGWPDCLRAVAVTALLVEEATKLTMGQALEVLTPQQVQGLLGIKGHQWLTGGHLTKYQALLLNSPEVTVKVCQTLNPATLMPIENPEVLSHSCTETIEQVYSSRPDLRDQPLEDPDAVRFMDRSSYIHDGIRKAGYAIVDLHGIIEAGALPPQTLA